MIFNQVRRASQGGKGKESEAKGEINGNEERREREKQKTKTEDPEANAAIDHPEKSLEELEPPLDDAALSEQGVHPPPQAHPETRRPKALRPPTSPEQKEVDEHVLTHVPYVDWCEVCRRCRRPNAVHGFKSEDDRRIPMLTVDDCFLHAQRRC